MRLLNIVSPVGFLLLLLAPSFVVAQIAADPFGGPVEPIAEGEPCAEKPAAKPVSQPTVIKSDPREQFDPTSDAAKRFQLELIDGSRLRGELDAAEITVTTSYGKLVVPVIEMIRLTPGLNTRDNLRKRLVELVEELGAEDYSTRDAAQAKLIQMGPSIEPILRNMADGDNVEQAAKLNAIYDKFDDLEQTWGQAAVQPMQMRDEVSTRQFNLLGDVELQNVSIQGIYGNISVPLSSIRTIRRVASGQPQMTFHSVEVKAINLTETNPQDVDVAVEVGDVISVRATGTIRRTSSTTYYSTPAGSSKLGTISTSPRLYGGALMARVGNAGEFVQVGADGSFTAQTNGKLQVGIAMSSVYARYEYDGGYEVKVRIKHGE